MILSNTLDEIIHVALLKGHRCAIHEMSLVVMSHIIVIFYLILSSTLYYIIVEKFK